MNALKILEEIYNRKNKKAPANLAGRLTEAKKLNSYTTDKLTAKMWIFPDGKVQSLNLWHYRWLQANPKVAAKYGLNVAKLPDEEQPVRLAALKVGFVRVNYELRDGTITIESNVRHWTSKIKDSVFMLVADNVESIYNIRISLLDDKGNVKKQAYAQLFQYDDKEKLDHIPFITESIKGNQFWVDSDGKASVTSDHSRTAREIVGHVSDPAQKMFENKFMRVSVHSGKIWFETSRSQLVPPTLAQRRFLNDLAAERNLEVINGFNGRTYESYGHRKVR